MDAHENEYLAAAACIHDQTPRTSAQEPAIGDTVSGRSAGRHWTGKVESIDGDRLRIDIGGGWLFVLTKDITH